MDDDEKTMTSDTDEEMASMMFAAGLWHMEHAQWVSVTWLDCGGYRCELLVFCIYQFSSSFIKFGD